MTHRTALDNPLRVAALLGAATLVAALGAACSDDGGSGPAPDVGADVGEVGDTDNDPADPDVLDADNDTDASNDADTDAPDAPDAPTGEGLFAAGCPGPGRALARQIAVDASLDGPAALGGRDDYLLANEHAAFVIQDVRYATDPDDEVHTWWYYGGQPIDAVALRDCAPTGPDRFDEMGFIVGRASIAEIDQSVLRGFRADSIEVVADGSDGGAAIVRARGTDDRFWLIELELVRRAFEAGRPTGLSEPLGVEIAVDYILEPGAPVLRIELTITNTGEGSASFVAGILNFFGDGTTVTRFNRSTVEFGGFSLPIGIPWLSGTASDGTWTVSMADAAPASLSVSGVDALVDANQFIGGATIPAGGSRTDTYLFAVGEGALDTTLRHLHAFDPEPSTGFSYEPVEIAVEVVDASNGDPLPGAVVVLERRNDLGEWLALDAFTTDDAGRFDGAVPRFAGGVHRLRAGLGGRPRPEPVSVDLAALEPIRIEIERSGWLDIDVDDTAGRPLPAKVLLWRDGREHGRVYHVQETASLEVPPGDYELTVSRGFEYGVHTAPITIVADERATLDVTLERVIDTSGYMAMDGHIHAGPSPDSGISIPTRLVTLAAEGIEVAVSTDHEAIVPWSPFVAETGLQDWITTVLGAEVTATLPEHSNAYPFPDLSDEHPRGRPVRWYGLAIGEFYAASRARGAQVVALNHPRNNCAYMCLVGYDRLTGDATLDQPTALGFAPGSALWSWDFDTIEFMNGHASPFVDPERPESTGLFEDWMSFHNLGHRITATGVTDVHGLDAQGSPRNYVEMPTDEPSEFRDQMLVDAMLGGRSLVSAGAFARVAIGEATMGDTVSAPDGEATLSLRVEALPEIDVTDVLVFANCDEIARVATDDPDAVLKLDTVIELTLERDAHVVVAGFGRGPMPRALEGYDPARTPRFVTNPIFVDVDGDGEFTPPGGKTCAYVLPGSDKAEAEPDAERHAESTAVPPPLLRDFRPGAHPEHAH